MEEQLISFKTAVLSKEKGFEELCFYYYNKLGKLEEPYDENGSSTDVEFRVDLTDLLKNYNFKHNYYIQYSAPTQSLLQRWLREEHKIHIEIKPVPFGQDYFKWIYKIGLMGISNFENISRKNSYSTLAKQNEKYFDTYEESLEAGLFEVLLLI